MLSASSSGLRTVSSARGIAARASKRFHAHAGIRISAWPHSSALRTWRRAPALQRIQQSAADPHRTARRFARCRSVPPHIAVIRASRKHHRLLGAQCNCTVPGAAFGHGDMLIPATAIFESCSSVRFR